MATLITSPSTPQYNCIAWAAGDATTPWWPDGGGYCYWPAEVAREETLECFMRAYETLGYERCIDESYVDGIEKIVLYAKDGKPTHAARQLGNGWWTSKLGSSVDISHSSPEAVCEFDPVIRDCYGEPVIFMQRVRR